MNLFRKRSPEEIQKHEEAKQALKQSWSELKATLKGRTVEQLNAEQEYIQQVINGNNMPIMQAPSGTILKKNEACHLAGECIYLAEKSAGVGYGGARVKVSNNITLSGGNARKVTQQVNVKGYFIITNQRFMFTPYGNEQGFNTNLNKIESYEFYKDGLLVRTSSKNYMLSFSKKDTPAIEPVFMGALANIG